MADILLKDKNGNDVTYEGVTQIEIPNTSGETTVFEESGNMASAVAYYGVFPEGITSQVTITGQWFAAVGKNYAIASLTDAQCKEIGLLNDSGNYMLAVVFSKNGNLQVGETYNFEDL